MTEAARGLPSAQGAMRVKVYVTLKSAVLDPQGKAIERSLHSIGYREVGEVRAGKYLEFDLRAPSREAAHDRVREMCEQLLANPVIEDYRFEIEGEKPSAVGNPSKSGLKADG